ncbi:MAG: YdcF family protein, partial [Burkholderiales bacterium]
ERHRYAAPLHRQTTLPLLVSGGAPYGNASSEALQMRAVLAQDFDTPVKWLEVRAVDTFQSALLARGILEAERIDRIVLITHAAHMRHARFAFERAGFEVIPVATGYTTAGPRTVVAFLPSAEGLMMGHTLFHEMIGLGWYHLRFASRHSLAVAH